MDEGGYDAAIDTALLKALDDAISKLENNARTTTASMYRWTDLVKASDLKPGNRMAREPFIIREEEELGNDWLVS